MKPIEVKELQKQRFDAYVAHSRSPAASYISVEIGWYSNESESVLGVVLLDTIDNDFAAVILGRDEHGAFCAFDQRASFPTEDEATQWLKRTIIWHTGQDKVIFPQGGTKTGVDLFQPVVSAERLHPYFARLVSSPAFLPARLILNEIATHFIDIDGNFVEQFQTTGFDSRLWELYIQSYLVEEELFVDRDYHAPDFKVTKYGKSVSIESVIVGRSTSNPAMFFGQNKPLPTQEEILDAHLHEMPIRFGSPLFSKLKKEYWKRDHVAGNPLVFAIADFHDNQSMTWSGTALINYLYGVRHDFHHDNDGKLIISPIVLDTHKVGDKEVPSGYFFQPDAENVSAILFSASGTISKFNRMGRQAGFKHPDVVMMRVGMAHRHDPNASLPMPFSYEVDESSTETWGEGLSMFHNPNALYPVPQELFPSIAHHRFVDRQIVSDLPEFHPYASFTYNLIKRK